MTTPAPTVFVVDDDPSFLPAVSRLLRAGGFAVKTFGSAGEFLEHCARSGEVAGCVIADLQMPGLTGLELQEALRRGGHPLPLIFLTGHGDIPSTVRAMRNGAEDFLTKRASQAELFEAVNRALARAGREREERDRVRALRERFDTLTPREREVLSHVLRGRLNKQIADDLGASERTIKAHRANLTEKLGVQSVAELVRLAQQADFPG